MGKGEVKEKAVNKTTTANIVTFGESSLFSFVKINKETQEFNKTQYMYTHV